MRATATLRDELDAATSALEAAGIPEARVDAEWLLAGLMGLGRARLRMDLGREVSAALGRRFADAVSRRARREPLQRILGWEEFRGLRLRLTDAVLVPRPETEALVEWALELLPPPGDRQLLAVDLGTGSGCIACALAAERGDVDVLALDVCSAAAAVARENAQVLGLASRISVVVTDLLHGVGDLGADLIVSNPPYLPSGLVPELLPEVRSHEPSLALDGGVDGLALIRRIAVQARRVLRPSGALVVETAGDVQAAAAATLLRAEDFTRVETRADLAGVTRFVAGRA
jgi:release factor glutamine methyltransferase